MRTRLNHGLTLIEVMVGVAIAAVLVAAAVPSFVTTIARSRLDSAMSGLSVDLQYTRSEAIRRRTAATLRVAADGASYTVSYTNPANNTEVDLKTVAMPTDVSLASPAPITFDSLRGIAAAQTLTGSNSRISAQLRVLTNATGRVQMCSPNGSFTGYASC
jgi:type IV fimbrial biogenesis protein FimT